MTELRISLSLNTEDAVNDVEDVTLWHYHFQDWRDHGVPSGHAVDELRKLVLEVQRKREESGGGDSCEVWVHWSVSQGKLAFRELELKLLTVPLE